MRARLSVVGAVGAVLVFAAACGSSDQPGRLASESPSVGASSTSSASPSSSPSPSESVAESPENEVRAAVQNYYATINDAVGSMDATAIKPLITEKCPCVGVIEQIDANNARGYRYSGFAYTDVSVIDIEVGGTAARAVANYGLSSYDLLTDQGAVAEHYDATTGGDALNLSLEAGTWRISRVTVLQ